METDSGIHGFGEASLNGFPQTVESAISELQQYSELIKDDVFAVLKLEGSVSTRNHVGGTAPAQVKTQIARLKKQI